MEPHRPWTALAPQERRWAEQLMDAILAIEPSQGGLPPLETLDLTAFWGALDTTTGPLFLPGLRAMVWGLTFWPLTQRPPAPPLFAQARHARVAFVEHLDHHGPAAARKLLLTLKMLASLAYLDHPQARAAVVQHLAIPPHPTP